MDWVKGSLTSKKPQGPPAKKQKVDDQQKQKEKHVCLQCLERYLQGKQEERSSSICRPDNSSVQRHKNRWHQLPDREKCTFVPASSPSAVSLRDKYCKRKDKVCPATSNLSEVELLENQVTKDPSKLTKEITDESAQTTLFDFSKSVNTCATSGSGEDASMKHVLDAISALSIKIDTFSDQHRSLEQLACEDNEVRRSVQEIRKANNIIELNNATQLLEWYYDEITECAILRCLPCFELHVVSRPTLRPLTPFRAQQLLNPTGSGTLPTGIFVNKETSRRLISGHNQTWYRQKNYCLDHLCFVGRGSAKHEKAMKEYRKKKEQQKRTSTACRNLFRAAIAEVKLGAAGKHFETLISLLASCSVDVGRIGHGRNNFNHIMYCLEKVLDERTGAWLLKPLPSTLLPPHFWETADKATPSRATNQAALIVARDSSGTPCPIPVAAPEIYNDFKDATYDSLAKQLLDAISEHFSSQILSRLCAVGADGPYQATGF